MTRAESAKFAPLLRHWRARRGLSQLELSVSVDVSSRQISILETGLAQPSREMVLMLAAALDVPLRDQNALLTAAGFEPQFSESSERALPEAIERALSRMLEKQEPYPMVVLNHRYDVLRANRAAESLLSMMAEEPSALPAAPNLMHLLFDPRRARPFVVGWERLARSLLTRLRCQALARPGDDALPALICELLAYPEVPTSFQPSDFAEPLAPTLPVRLHKDEWSLDFLTTLTVFDAPLDVTLQELMLESFFPLDDATELACERLALGSVD